MARPDQYRDPKRPAPFRAALARIATTIIGLVLLIYGIVAAISPLPVGVPLAILGLLMIAGANPAFRPVIRSLRTRWRWFDKLVILAGTRGSPSIKGMIVETTPAGQNVDQAEEKENRSP